MPASLTPVQRVALLQTLAARFAGTMSCHPKLTWPAVQAALNAAPHALEVLHAMEATGGEPDVMDDPEHADRIVFMDCSAESPAGRRSLCYDTEALLSRKANPPKDSVMHMAASLGITLLSETQYRTLQCAGIFDEKTSSWIQTPETIRSLGGALFCDRRYGQVFLYHNGADSYYAARGFRGYIAL